MRAAIAAAVSFGFGMSGNEPAVIGDGISLSFGFFKRIVLIEKVSIILRHSTKGY